MTGALTGLAVRLQAEAQTTQQSSDQLLTGGEAALGQGTGEMTLALAHPKQRRLGVATDRRLHQLGQCLHQSRLSLDLRSASTSRAADAARRCAPPTSQFRQTAANRAACNASHFGNCRNTAVPRRTRLTRREQPPRALVQLRCQRLKARFDSLGVDHSVRLVRATHRFLAPDSLVSRRALIM